MTFYTANCRGNAKNSLYPNRRTIDNEDDCMEVVAFDHVCAEFKNCRRSGDHFLSCDVDVMDCDNSHTYHRVNGAGKWVYWYCIGKKRKNVECHNPNYTDYKLRQVSAHMMGLEEFDEAEFENQVEGITALEDGSLEFNFYGGRKERWQRA